jgi:hypothetical protein
MDANPDSNRTPEQVPLRSSLTRRVLWAIALIPWVGAIGAELLEAGYLVKLNIGAWQDGAFTTAGSSGWEMVLFFLPMAGAIVGSAFAAPIMLFLLVARSVVPESGWTPFSIVLVSGLVSGFCSAFIVNQMSQDPVPVDRGSACGLLRRLRIDHRNLLLCAYAWSRADPQVGRSWRLRSRNALPSSGLFFSVLCPVND